MKRQLKGALTRNRKTIADQEALVRAAEGNQEFEVDTITRKRQRKGETQYLVRWVGYGPDEDTWEPESHLSCPKKLSNFEQGNDKRFVTGKTEPQQKNEQAADRAATSKELGEDKTLPYQVKLCPDRRFGLGVFAKVSIPVNQFLFEFTGVRLRGDAMLRKHRNSTQYHFVLSDGTVIDSSRGGNASRYVNCFKGLGDRPSIEAREELRDDGIHLLFFTTVDIAAGEQMLLDYGREYDNFDWNQELNSNTHYKRMRARTTCKHTRQLSRCKGRGGSSIVEHNSLRSTCKGCKGSSRCEHNRQRHTYKPCGGGSICEHNMERYTCEECGGSGKVCKHNMRRSESKECKGSGICEHRRRRYTCKQCGGGSICEHNRQRYTCKECGGSGICKHNMQRRSSCKQ